LGISEYNLYDRLLLNHIQILLICSLQTLEMLEKKEKVLLKKAGAEVEKAKEYSRAKNKRGMTSYLL
jgi:hypothetical protein